MANTTLYNRTLPAAPISQIDYTGYVFVPLFFVMGIIGNSLTIRVMLTKSFRSMPVSKSLIALSLSDTGVNLLFPFNKPFVRALLGTDIRALSSGGCKLYFWAYRFFKITSSWMVVAISCERFVAVWLPIKARTLNTTRNTYIVIASIYCVLAIFIGYWCSWADRIIDDRCIVNSRPEGKEVESQVFIVFGVLLYGYIPAGVLLVLNGLIAYKLVVVRKKTATVAPHTASDVNTSKPNTKDQKHTKTTGMLLCVAIAFVILVTPNSTAHIVSFAKKQTIFETTDKGMVFLREISQIMEQLNHSINFFLYVLCCKRFRERVLVLFKTKSNKNSANETTQMSIVNSQPKKG